MWEHKYSLFFQGFLQEGLSQLLWSQSDVQFYFLSASSCSRGEIFCLIIHIGVIANNYKCVCVCLHDYLRYRKRKCGGVSDVKQNQVRT